MHLDQIYWSPGDWQHLEQEEFDRRLQIELDKPQWIMDGNFNRTLEVRLERADTVIYLDYNCIVCLLHYVKRVITNWGKAREDMGPGCSERFDLAFMTWIWQFNDKNRARYHGILQQHPEKEIHIFRNGRQLRRFLKALPCNCGDKVL